MAEKAFPGLKAVGAAELTEGFFNAAYRVSLSDGRNVILKIAPPAGSLIMTYEKNIMYAEVESMRLVKEKTGIPLAEILFCDRSHTVCPSDYFFMSEIEGRSLNAVSGELSEEDRDGINYHVGELNAELNRITGESFGYFSQPDRQEKNWYGVFSGMINDALNDADALNIDTGIGHDTVSRLLSRDKGVFEEVTVPRLVHWDLWAGNVFVKDGRITGLIDFERCLWADELMEVGFRSQNQDPHFLKGYGMKELTDTQTVRVKWYDLYLFLIMSLECDYRKYPSRDQLDWARGKIKETAEWIQKRKTGDDGTISQTFGPEG